ncbi:unnamed protein product [Caenorhabditis angaria]|uniref:Acyl_transf_3 domain-containing protein n=1 Tax=Caenorhabditis angaria TaxID=860376 RepID=A0A9P1ITB0_9PELO|nr:unnamed protein product [Caenorhabditis angaria]
MKRLDLQGVRGIAILAVLGFHLFPKLFPNGYLGVDQFFVLSGFLMCMLLTKSEKTEQSTWSLIKNFYIRRFRRILPLYYLIIFLSLIFLYLIFPDTAIVTNENSAKKALLFLSNRLKTDEENYFEMLSIAVDIFTHTWSLSVEIQFYLLAPFIFLLPSRIASMIYLSIGSFIYFYYLPPTGMIAFILCETSMQENQYKLVEDLEKNCAETKPSTSLKPNTIISVAFTILVILINFNQLPLPQNFVRPITTFLTTGIILFSNGENNKILSNKFITYIGDISYSLYLIHWPIYAYWKLTNNGNLVILFYSMMISIILAMIIYNYFETWYISLSNRNIAILTGVLLMGNVIILHRETINKHISQEHLTNFTSLDGITPNMTLDDAKRINYAWNTHDTQNLITPACNYATTKPLGWCNITGLDQNNEKKYKIIIIGNSWAANHAHIFYQECGYKARIMLIGAKYGCEPLYPSLKYGRCQNEIIDFQKHVEDFKPDYAFHITRHISYGEPFLKDGDFKNDPIYKIMLNNTKILTKNIKNKFYILNAIPRMSSTTQCSIPNTE